MQKSLERLKFLIDIDIDIDICVFSVLCTHKNILVLKLITLAMETLTPEHFSTPEQKYRICSVVYEKSWHAPVREANFYAKQGMLKSITQWFISESLQ